ncbi:MAG: hypothetical protein EP329_13525 [Deltaproteobacteria bacterium]|nr:MAG: hypothetical protein EP329_13525 [Deltaproteobacteria bacterium]
MTGSSSVERIVGRLVDWVERHPWLVIAVAVLVAGLSVWLTTKLKVVQDLKILLPPDAPSISRLEEVDRRMGNLDDLLVQIKSPSRDANLKFGEAIAPRLSARDDIRFALFHQDRTYFEDHALLYVSLADLLELRDRVIKRIKKEVAASFNEGFEDEPDDGADKPPDKVEDDLGDLSGDALREKYGIDEKLPEYFEADEGRVIVVKARPIHQTTDVAFTKEMIAGVEADIAALAPHTFHPEMEVTIEGAYAKRRKNVNSIAGDAARGTAVAALLLVLCIGFYFRRIRAVPLVMVPLLLSVVTALGYAQLRYGFLNLVSAFIFAVLLGVGIDFGLHVLGRYEAERGRGHDRAKALKLVLSTTGMSTLTGAASTIGVYGILMIADFQGFAQFGELAAVGVLSAAISVFTVMPAFIVVFERWFPWKPSRRQQRTLTAPEPPVRRPTRGLVIAAMTALVFGLGTAVASSVSVPKIEFEYNFNKLGPKPVAQDDDDEDKETEKAASYKDAVGKEATTGPVVALTKDLAQTEWVHRMLASAMDMTDDEAAHFDAVRAGTYVAPPKPAEDTAPAKPAEDAAPAAQAGDDEDDWGDEDDDAWDEQEDPKWARLRAEASASATLSKDAASRFDGYSSARVEMMHGSLIQVLSLFTFIPERQEDKLTVIRDIRRRIDAKRKKLSEDTRKKLEDVERYLAVNDQITVAALPEWVKVQFTDTDGKLGQFVIFRNSGTKSDYLVAKNIETAFFDLPTPTGNVETAGNVYIMPAMLDTVAHDGPIVVSLALVVVLVTALLLFRTFFGMGAVALTVSLGVLWVVGMMEIFDWKANFFNIIAIPLLLGMGQDYAVHMYHRYLHDGVGRLRRVVRETGGVVFMTTLTTAIGFGGILFANHRGLLSMAWTSVAGLIACFVAAVIILPSLIIAADWVRRRRATDPVAEE